MSASSPGRPGAGDSAKKHQLVQLTRELERLYQRRRRRFKELAQLDARIRERQQCMLFAQFMLDVGRSSPVGRLGEERSQ